MYLELHDNEEGNTLCARINNLDYAYQGEQWVQDTSFGDGHEAVIKWILFDEQGPACIWERPIGSTEIPSVTQRAERFTGAWEKGSNEIMLPVPTEAVTLNVRSEPYKDEDDDGLDLVGNKIIGEVKRGEAVLHTETVFTDDTVESVCDVKEFVALKVELWAVQNTNFMPEPKRMPQ